MTLGNKMPALENKSGGIQVVKVRGAQWRHTHNRSAVRWARKS